VEKALASSLKQQLRNVNIAAITKTGKKHLTASDF
jgi:hypothetical protein